jgi:hypothetical protein
MMAIPMTTTTFLPRLGIIQRPIKTVAKRSNCEQVVRDLGSVRLALGARLLAGQDNKVTPSSRYARPFCVVTLAQNNSSTTVTVNP